MPFLFAILAACSTATPPAPPSGPPAASVEVAPVRDGGLSDTWTMLGEVRALERAELAAGATGAVDSVHGREGDAVAQGALLVEIDPSLASAQVATAKAEEGRITAELAQAKRTLERSGRVDRGVLAANELEQLQTRVAMLEAQQEGASAGSRLARATLGRHLVRAPFAGVVARRHVDPGDWVSPGVPVMDLVRADGVEVRVDAPLELASKVLVGDAVRLTETVTGHVVGIVPALDPVSRTAIIRVEPDGPLGNAIPGSALQVAFDVKMSGGVVVPRDALVAGPTDSRVFKVVDGRAMAVVVRTLASTADELLVDGEGLQPGDPVVIRGNERLRPDQPVQVL